MTVICTVCARGGSKGLPQKNIRPLCGKPLIAYTIEQALAANIFEGIYVSTDCDKIAKIAEEYGAIVPFRRPEDLASDSAGKIPVIEHLVNYIEKGSYTPDIVVDLDPTSPLRNVEDIINTVNMLKKNVDVVITGFLSNKNPYFNMVEKKRDDFVRLSKESSELYVSRQTSPAVYSMNASIYVWWRDALKKGIWGNKNVAFYEMPLERSIDIDSYLDWKIVEQLMLEKLGASDGRSKK
jgi:CMP-N-acetylneuraminic acid synthetase